MTDAERMARVLLELRMNAATLGRSIGKRGGDSITAILKRRYKISAELARLISDTHRINYKWLLTGEGEDIFEPVVPDIDPKTTPSDQLVAKYEEFIHQQKALIGILTDENNRLREEIRKAGL